MKTPQLFGGEPVIQFKHEESRRNFLRNAALVGVGGSLVAAGLGERLAVAQQAGSGGDVDILAYALTLEQLEAEFYVRGLEAGLLQGRELELVTPIGEHEAAHVTAVSQAIEQLGGTPAPAPTFNFPEEVFADRAAFLMNASTFEELGVTAYHGQVPLIESPEILAAAAAIAGVESRHAAVIADISGGDPFPAVVEATRTMEEVLAAAQPFIQS